MTAEIHARTVSGRAGARQWRISTPPLRRHLSNLSAGSLHCGLSRTNPRGSQSPILDSALRKRRCFRHSISLRPKFEAAPNSRAPSVHLPQTNHRRSPSSSLCMRKCKRSHLGKSGQNGVDRLPQCSRAFAVDDPYFENSLFAARRQIRWNQILYVTRPERVQIQHSFNGQFNRIVWRFHNKHRNLSLE